MPRSNGLSAAFTGGSGQMAVMGELLDRRCNAAVPHVDIGMDVFAFLDHREEVARIQVKTARGKRYRHGGGYYTDFRVPLKQLERIDNPPLFYALAVRLDYGWGNFIVISRTKLKELRNEGCGTERDSYLRLYVKFRPNQEAEENEGVVAVGEPEMSAYCNDIDLTAYINAWESLPPLKRQVAIHADETQNGDPNLPHV